MAPVNRLRSRISFWAFSGSFQKAGSSTSAFSSSARALARSQSKTPPEQRDGRVDLFGKGGDVGAHWKSPAENQALKIGASRPRRQSWRGLAQ
jgi:hypothetical protein